VARREAGALGLVARAELRERGWSLLVLGIVLGVVGGIVLGAVSVGERTATAYPRLLDAVHLDDARVLVPADQPATIAALPTMPGVADVWTADAYIARMDGGDVRFIAMIAGTAPHPDLLTPIVVAGRMPAPDAPDEVVVSEQIAEGGGLALGTEATMRLLSLRNVADFAVGFTADGPPSRLKVVGVVRMPHWGGTLADVIGGPGFARANAAGAVATAGFVRLDGSPGAVTAFFDALAAAQAAEPSVVGQYLVGPPETPRLTVDEAVSAAERALLVGDGLFALVVALGALQMVGLGLLRTAAAAREPRAVEAALGMTTAESLGARLLAALPAAVLAALLGAGATLLAGTFPPLGSQARFESALGFRPQWTLAVGGGLVLGLVFLGLVSGAALVAWRRRDREAAATRAEAAPFGVADAVRRWPAVLLGSRLARSVGVRRGLPPLVAVLAAAAAVAGIVATVVVGASLNRLVEEPARWAAGSDVVLPDFRPDDAAALVADPRTTAVAYSDTVFARTERGDTLGMSAMSALKGGVPVQVVSGRAPQGPDEVAVNPRVAAAYGLAEGSVLTVVGQDGVARPLRTVGTAVLPRDDRKAPGQDLWVAPEALAAFAPPTRTGYVDAHPADVAALRAELSARLEVTPDIPPDAIRNLSDMVRLPAVLAVLLAVVAGTGLAHSLLVTARRVGREMAVFSVLGATPGQVRATLTVLAATTAVPAVLVGVPVGIGVARLFWWQVATSVGVGGDVAVPLLPIVALVAAVPVGAALVTAVPAVRLSRAVSVTALAAL
jgi:putative ABC transport system permease protein